MRSLPAVSPFVLVLCFPLGCSRDTADQEYFAALDIDKRGGPCEESLKHIDRAIELAPSRSGYWEKRSGYRIGLGDMAGAKADIDRAIELADRPYLRYLRGIILCKSGRCSEALSDLDRAIGAQPQNTQFYRVRAFARVRAGLAERALEDGERMLAQAPHWGESYYARGLALAGLGRCREAIASFDEALRRRPDLSYPLLARADCRERTGEPELAAADRTEAGRQSQGDGGCRGCGVCADPLHP